MSCIFAACFVWLRARVCSGLCIFAVWFVWLRARVCSVYLRRGLYICGVLNCDTKIAIYQDLFTYVIDVI